MFDSIYFKCEECGKKIEAQSKSGICALNEYNHTSVPIDVAIDANRHAPFHCQCGATYKFQKVKQKFVNLKIIRIKKK